jgi:hypothetical protein
MIHFTVNPNSRFEVELLHAHKPPVQVYEYTYVSSLFIKLLLHILYRDSVVYPTALVVFVSPDSKGRSRTPKHHYTLWQSLESSPYYHIMSKTSEYLTARAVALS